MGKKYPSGIEVDLEERRAEKQSHSFPGAFFELLDSAMPEAAGGHNALTFSR